MVKGKYIRTEETRKKISEVHKGKKLSKETKKKIGLKNSKALKRRHISPTTEFKKGQKVRLGCKHSQQTRNKISKGHIGKKNSIKHNRNISKAVRGKPKIFNKGNKHHLGYKHSLEVRRKIGENKERAKKISESNKGRIFSKEHKTKLKIARQNVITPSNDTTIEIKIQNFLKQLRIEFFTHKYITEIEHGYQCDILIPYLNLVIECDGNYWHKYPIGRKIDIVRTQELLDKGFRVLRFWESEIRVITLPEFKNKLYQFKENLGDLE